MDSYRLNRLGFLCILLVFWSLLPQKLQAQENSLDETIPSTPYAAMISAATLTSVTAERGAFVGASFQGNYLLGKSPFYLTSRIIFGDSVTGNNTWRFDHYHQIFDVGVGVQKKMGRGTLFGQITGGALGVYEVASHHQIVRVGEALGRFTNWSVGPMVASEIGLELQLVAGFSSRMAVGPTWTLQKINDDEASIFGATANLGLRYDF